MSDWLDPVRAGNPVPRPQPLDADVRRRIALAILADDASVGGEIQVASCEPPSPGRPRRRRVGGGRPLALILTLCLAGGTGAAAVGGAFAPPTTVHGPATPGVVAGVAVASSVLVLAAGLNDRGRANPRLHLTQATPAP